MLWEHSIARKCILNVFSIGIKLSCIVNILCLGILPQRPKKPSYIVEWPIKCTLSTHIGSTDRQMDSNQSQEESQKGAVPSLKRQTIVESSCDLLIKRANKEFPLFRHKHLVALFAKTKLSSPHQHHYSGLCTAQPAPKPEQSPALPLPHKSFPAFGSICVQPVEDCWVRVLCKWYMEICSVSPSHQATQTPELSSNAFVSKLTVVT